MWKPDLASLPIWNWPRESVTFCARTATRGRAVLAAFHCEFLVPRAARAAPRPGNDRMRNCNFKLQLQGARARGWAAAASAAAHM